MTTPKLMHDAGSKTLRHVIFIHGLAGDFKETWQSSSNEPEFWPTWLYEEIPGTCIWTVGYNAAMTRWFGGQAMHLTDRGKNILESLLIEKKLQTGELIFIGHSLGGLIIKQVLKIADSQSYTRPEVSNFIKRVKKVAFLGTPHLGSALATFGKLLLIKPSLSIASLIKNDPNLRDLNNRYKDLSIKYGIENLVLIESQPIKFLWLFSILIVSSESADPGLQTHAIPIDKNHKNICKPDSKNSEIYLHIKNLIYKEVNVTHTGTVVENKIDLLDGKIEKGFNTLFSSLADQPEKIADSLFRKSLTLKASAPFSHSLFNSQLEKQLCFIKKARFFHGFPFIEHANRLAKAIIEGDLSNGEHAVKCCALAWCARFQSASESIEQAIISYNEARKLGNTEEVIIAGAFIDAAKNLPPEEIIPNLMIEPSPLNYSAALAIMTKYKGERNAIDWMIKSGIEFSNLDPDGKAAFLSSLLFIHQWKEAFEFAKTLTNYDLNEAPFLLYLSAMAHLVMVVPSELRYIVLHQVPLNAHEFDLFADTESLKLRKNAQVFFSKCEVIAETLGCKDVANVASDYALWLKLRDPNTFKNGIHTLEKSMSGNSQLVLRRFPMAFFFKLDLKLEAIEAEIDKESARLYKKSPIAGLARYVFAISKQEPNKILQYVEKHRDEISAFITKDALYSLEIEASARAGMLQNAKELLESAKNEFSPTRYKDLKIFIDTFEGKDPIKLHIANYKKTSSINDLYILVDHLEKDRAHAHIKELHKYADILFLQTKSPQNAEKLLRAKCLLGKYNGVYQFFNNNPEFIYQSQLLHLHYAWALFQKGKLKECKKALNELKKSDNDNPNIRALEISLAITSGEWESLSTYITSEWNKRAERTAKELLHVAQLAKSILPSIAKKLIRAAMEKAEDDPMVSAGAYFVAHNMGWENEAGVSDWFRTALKNSSKEGPIQTISIEELVSKQIPEQEEHRNKIWKALHEAKIPLFSAAHLLNQSLIDFYLLKAIENETTNNVNYYVPIPAFSHLRAPVLVQGTTIAFDVTALFTLGYLNILDEVINCFKKIILPHSTLSRLFFEKQKVVFHQPSQIENAKLLEKLLADRKINIVLNKNIINPEIAFEIGHELALLLQEIKNYSDDDKSQKLIVRSSPVYKADSFMKAFVDMTPYIENLCNCSTLIRKLYSLGILSKTEEQKALSYLCQQEIRWPNDIEIQDGANLYLDSSSIALLQDCGLLEKLTHPKLNIYVHQLVGDRNRTLITYESFINRVDKITESIKEILVKNIESEKIELAEIPDAKKVKDEALRPAVEMFLAAKKSDAAVIDDRFFNRAPLINYESHKIPIYTSLDLLDYLVSQKIISDSQSMSYRALLRQAGYFFIPITKEELYHYLKQAPINDGYVQATPELKAIQESFLQLRLKCLVSLPQDNIWLANIFRILSDCLKSQWINETDSEICEKRSNWLLQLIDSRKWTHCFDGFTGSEVAKASNIEWISYLISVPQGITNEMLDKYWGWLEEAVIAPLKYSDPIGYNLLIKFIKEQISHVIKNLSNEGGAIDNK